MDKTAEFILTHRTDDVRTLALQGGKFKDIDMNYAIAQIAGWQKAKEKLPRWAATEGVVYPPHLPLEQCSSEQTAELKRKIIDEFSRKTNCPTNTYADLTAGFGVDFCTIAPLFRETTYVERQETLCQAAKNNFPKLGINNATIVNGDGIEHLETMEHADWLFLDPARRNSNGGKVVALEDCEPNVVELEDTLLAKATHTMIKLSPMLDISLACQQMKHVEQIHVVSLGGECKELLLIIGKEEMEPQIVCTNIEAKRTQSLTFSQAEERSIPLPIADMPQAGQYLYEPGSAILKGGASAVICKCYGVSKIHPNSNLYISEEQCAGFPGRTFSIEFCCTFSKQDIKQNIAPLKKANLTIRNFPSTVAELRKKLKLKEGGDTYIFATTLHDGSHALIGCKRTQKTL